MEKYFFIYIKICALKSRIDNNTQSLSLIKTFNDEHKNMFTVKKMRSVEKRGVGDYMSERTLSFAKQNFVKFHVPMTSFSS